MIKLQTQLFLSTQNSQQDFIDYSRRSIKFQPKVRLLVVISIIHELFICMVHWNRSKSKFCS